MIVSINQPAYLPWSGYFHRIGISDLHIVLDHVQFEKNSFVNRNRIRTHDGWAWLTVPVRTKGRFGQLSIKDLEVVSSQRWAAKHWMAMVTNYSAAAHFQDHVVFFQELYEREWETLGTLLDEVTRYLLRTFRIETPLRFSSELEPSRHKDELVLELCRRVGATTYVSGPFGRDYLHPERFESAGIDLVFDDYVDPLYAQAYPGFEPRMSVVDLLFNHGESSREILMMEGT